MNPDVGRRREQTGVLANTPTAVWRAATSLRTLWPPVAVLVVAVVVWEVGVRAAHMPRYLLVPPSEVGAYLHLHLDLFIQQGLITAEESIGGLLLGSALGIALAIAIVHSQFLSRALMPLIVGSQVVPKPAIAPLLVVWMGFGIQPKLLVAALIAFFPVVMSHAYGMNSVPQDLLELGRSMRASGWKIFYKIRLPYSLPSLFSGLKVASSFAVIGAVVGEFVGASSGLGYLITLAGFRIDTTLMLASLLVLIVIGVVLYAAVAVAERVFVPWSSSLPVGDL